MLNLHAVADSPERFTDLERVPLSLAIGSFDVKMLTWGFIGPRPWRNYLHVHSFFEVCYVFAGRGDFHLLGTDHTVQAGEVLIARPGEAHEIRSSQHDPLGIYFWSYSFTPSHRTHDDPVLDTLVADFMVSPQVRSDRVPHMGTTIEFMTAEIVHREPGYLQALEGLVRKLLLDTCRATAALPARREALPDPLPAPDELIVNRIIAYLRDNFVRPVAIRDVAAQVNLSERHTNRIFQRLMGTPIAAYLTALRMETAAGLLLDGQLSIKEVARRSGYRDVHYFTALFHRHMGLPPSAFRRQHGTQFLQRSEPDPRGTG